MKRVVTGLDRTGHPTALFDGEPTSVEDLGLTQSVELWMTDRSPPQTAGEDDPVLGEWRLEPPVGGTIFRVATHQPGEEVAIHATHTVDYVIVLSGELVLLLGDEEIVLTAGDVVIQRATPHGWANRSAEPCSVAAVLLSTREDDEDNSSRG
jgi:quercetin dioxygenase-like cupin family protein